MSRSNSRQGELLRAIERLARERCAGLDPAHDALHVARVVRAARLIARSEPEADPFITEAASWLHDIVQLPKGSGVPGESARRSAHDARAFLLDLGVDTGTVDAIADAITTHSFSGGKKPASLEAAILQDADRLDALGAIGIARLWVTAGVLNSDLYHDDDPSARHRELDDRSFGLDHIAAKLLLLPDMMNTAAGRELARSRADFVQHYRDTFLSELSEDH